jgi:hypothetical protein
MAIVAVLWSVVGLIALAGTVLGLAAAFALGGSAYRK